MKKHLFILLLLLTGGGIWLPSLGYAQPGYKPKYLRENNRSLLDLASQANETGWIVFRSDKEAINPDNFFDRFGDALGLGKHYQMRLIKDETDFKQVRHQRYQLYYKTIPVESVEYSLHSRDKELAFVNGRMAENLDIDVEKPMPEKQALAFALAQRNLTEDEVKDKTKLPKGELVLTRLTDDFSNKSFRFCYLFEMRVGKAKKSHDAFQPERVYVDATTGELVRTETLMLNCMSTHNHAKPTIIGLKSPGRNYSITSGQLFANATFQPLFPGRFGTGPINFETEGLQSFNWLSLAGTGLNTRYAVGAWNFDFETFTVLWKRSQNTSISNTLNWGTNFQNGTTAHWLVQRLMAFWNTRFLRNGINGNGLFPHVSGCRFCHETGYPFLVF